MDKFNLAGLNTAAACDKGAEIELTHPTLGTPLGVFITVLGKDSEVFKNKSRGLNNAKIRRDAAAAKRGKDPEVRTMEVIEQENLELLAVCSTGWRTVKSEGVVVQALVFNDEEVTFNQENAIKVYSDYSWIFDQVNEGIGFLENFIKA